MVWRTGRGRGSITKQSFASDDEARELGNKIQHAMAVSFQLIRAHSKLDRAWNTNHHPRTEHTESSGEGTLAPPRLAIANG